MQGAKIILYFAGLVLGNTYKDATTSRDFICGNCLDNTQCANATGICPDNK